MKSIILAAIILATSVAHAEKVIVISEDYNEWTYSEQQNFIREVETGGVPQFPDETYSDAYNRAYQLENDPEQYLFDLEYGLTD